MFEDILKTNTLDHEETLYQLMASNITLTALLVDKNILTNDEMEQVVNGNLLKETINALKEVIKNKREKMAQEHEKNYKDGKINFIEYMFGKTEAK